MANKLKKALAELEQTRKMISEIKVEKPTIERRVIKKTDVTKPSVKTELPPVTCTFAEEEKFDTIQISKVRKGEFMALCKNSGVAKTKKFKSITKAEEWKASHLK